MKTLKQPRLPAEWEPVDAVQLTWPHAGTDWQPRLAEVLCLYEELVVTLARVCHLLIAAPGDEVDSIRGRFAGRGIPLERLHVYPAESDDTWARDHGPITVETEEGPCLLDYRFNGWGNKFAAGRDNWITATLFGQGAYPGARLLQRDLVLEGGAIESDGQGTLLTTTKCLLNPNRNPALSREEIEAHLARDLGVSRVLWLEHGALEGDDTDSHVDTLARLCPDGVIAYQACDDGDDLHYDEMQAMAAELSAFTDATGAPYKLVPLPWPSARYDEAGERLPATYANFLIVNGHVLVPTYRDPRDGEALGQVAAAFPRYTIVGLDCLPLIRQHGSLHCITMQLPRGVLCPGSH